MNSSHKLSGLLDPLRNRDFVRLWISNGLWWQSMWIEHLVIGWLALEMTDSAWRVALLGFFRSAPMPLVGMFGPLITERFLRRHLVVSSQAVTLATVVMLGLLHYHDELKYWHLTAAALVTGASWAFDWPTRRSMIPDMCGKARVVDAMFLDNALQSLTRISGPLAAGSLVGLLGTKWALLVLIVAAAISLSVLAGMRSDSKAPERAGSAARSLRRTSEGLQYVRGNRTILGVILITVAMNLWAFPYVDLLPVFARDILGRGALDLGLLGAAGGVGALLGLTALHFVRQRRSSSWIFAVSSVVSCVALIAFSQSLSFGLTLVILVVVGVGHAGFSCLQSAIILVESTDSMRARAMGALLLAIGFGPFGRLLAGALAQEWGAPFAVSVMSTGALLSVAAATLLLSGFVRPHRELTSAGAKAGRG